MYFRVVITNLFGQTANFIWMAGSVQYAAVELEQSNKKKQKNNVCSQF